MTSPDLLAKLDEVEAERRKSGQPCRTCHLPADVLDALHYARRERGFSYADCSRFLEKLGHRIIPTVVRFHFVEHVRDK